MSRRRTTCISWQPTSAAPWSLWTTVCGRVLGEGLVHHDWPLPASKRPAGVCPSCWTRVLSFGVPLPNDNAGGEP
jgi:hypothetical protein